MIFISQIILGVLIPFFGTTLGAAAVFFMRKNMSRTLSNALSAFAAGIMTASSVWSLILPSVELSENMGIFAFFPAASGFLVGNFFMFKLDGYSRKLIISSKKQQKITTTNLAVAIHNFPEGMAVGTVFGAVIAGQESATMLSAFILSVGIAVQNIPEGAIISMPLHAEGVPKRKAFLLGTLSGIVEPLGAALAICAMGAANVFMPYLLSFAAGTMLFVVTEQLIPEIESGGKVPLRAFPFALGFVLMMSLDVALS